MCLCLQTVSFFFQSRSKSFFFFCAVEPPLLLLLLLLPLDGGDAFPRRRRRQKDDAKDDSKPILLLLARDIITSVYSRRERGPPRRFTKPRIITRTNERTKKRTSFLRARERPSLVPVLVVLELRPAFHDHAAEARVDARGCFRLDAVRGRRHDDDDDVFLCARFFWSVKWCGTHPNGFDDEDSRFLYLGFRIFVLIFFWSKKRGGLFGKEKKRRKVVTSTYS